MRSLSFAVALSATLLAPAAAHAFCGFYVAGADAELYNNATMVVMMRDGTRTVLSMQNNYQGPPSDFAMVVPVPVVLQEENVKTLDASVFGRVDRLAAPRLVEYWEMDPCAPMPPPVDMAPTAGAVDESVAYEAGGGDGVTIEAQFTVGEYEIVILSASDSTGLDRWLRRNRYRIPAGAEKLLRPYVAAGMKFFVAKVDIEKVKRVGDKTMLSPLRFHYDADQFNLPVRLGMINSSGTQDLLVHILAPGQRYEVANYPNVTIPTNLNVSDETRKSFGAFFAKLFDATIEKHRGAVVTEYSWDAASCDPCPTPPLSSEDLATLGDDVINKGSYVLTRLHARYGKDALGEDLVFRQAGPIAGGREHVVGEGGKVERGAVQSPVNNFQGRYIIRHEWAGAINCDNPIRGRWGGPPEGGGEKLEAAADIAFAPRGDDIKLASFLRQDVEEIDFKVSEADDKAKFRPGGIQRKPYGCAGCQAAGGSAGALALLLVVGIALGRRRRRT